MKLNTCLTLPCGSTLNNRIAKAANDHGKSLGRMVEGADEGAKLYARGFDFIAIGTDTQLYANALGAELTALRDACD